jgi:hypothetical protein
VEFELPADATALDVARLAPFPVFALSASPELRKVASIAGRITGVAVGDGEIEVTTKLREQIVHSLPFEPENPERAARHGLLSSLLHRRAIAMSGLSAPARELAIHEDYRRADATAAAAPVREVEFTMDGEPHPFALVEADGKWAAAALVEAVAVKVTGEGAPASGLALQTVRPPA